MFAHTSFKWANLASYNAGVTVVIVGISNHAGKTRRLFSQDEKNKVVVKETENINAYLVAAENIEIHPKSKPFGDLAIMQFGNHPYYGSGLIYLSILRKREPFLFSSIQKVFLLVLSLNKFPAC